MKRLRGLILLFAFCGGAAADHDSGAPLSWHIISGGLDESRVALYRYKQLIGIFDFACDLTSANGDDTVNNGASLQLVRPASHPEGLLLVICNVGAHSQHISIVDPQQKGHHAVFARTGSYFVSWEIQDGELWISHDRACDTGPTIECPDGFETVFETYPEQ